MTRPTLWNVVAFLLVRRYLRRLTGRPTITEQIEAGEDWIVCPRSGRFVELGGGG